MNHNHFKVFLKTLYLLIPVLMILTGCSNREKPEEYITIGAILPLTGDNSSNGLNISQGLHLAKEEINENGGVLGKKLDLIVLNDNGNVEQALHQYESLKEKGVIAIIGSGNQEVISALVDEVAKDGILFISTSPISENVKEKLYDNVFNVMHSSAHQNDILANFSRNVLGARTAAAFSPQGDLFAEYMLFDFIMAFGTHGGGIRSIIHRYSSVDEFEELLRHERENPDPPDLIFCADSAVNAAILVNTAHELGGFENTDFVGLHNWDGILPYLSSDAIDNVYFTSTFSIDDTEPMVEDFISFYFSHFSNLPNSETSLAYTSMGMLAVSIENAGTTSTDDIISAMKDYEPDMMSGHVYFDENNVLRTNVYIIRVKNGIYKMFDKYNAEREGSN